MQRIIVILRKFEILHELRRRQSRQCGIRSLLQRHHLSEQTIRISSLVIDTDF